MPDSAEMQIKRQSRVSNGHSTSVNVHSPQGERRIQVSIEAWLSYYKVKDTKGYECLLDDVMMVVDTFGDLLDIRKGWSPETGRVDARGLDNVTKAMVLLRAVTLRDSSAMAVLRQACSRLLATKEFKETRCKDPGSVVDEAVKSVIDSLCDEDSPQIPVPLEDLVYVHTCEILTKKLNKSGKGLPLFLAQARQQKQSELDALLKAARELEVIEDKIGLLRESQAYCDCIKRSLFTLKPDETLLLALHYYENEQVPADDVLEALIAARKTLTRDNGPLTKNNLYQKLHRVLRNALPACLAREFAAALDRKVKRSLNQNSALRTEGTLEPFLRRSSGYLVADYDELLKFCKDGVGGERGALMSDDVIRVCRLLRGGPLQVSADEESSNCKDRGGALI